MSALMTDCPLDARQMEILLRLTQGQRRKFIGMKMNLGDVLISKALSEARIASESQTTEQLVAKAVRKGWIR